MAFIATWLLIGALCTIVWIFLERRDGTTHQKYELYLAVIGVLLGAITGMIYIYSRMKPHKSHGS